MVIHGIDQFRTNYQENILKEINKLGGRVLKPTISLCHQCHYHIPAYRYELNDSVYICKNCAIHGHSHHMIERSAEFYHSLIKDPFPIEMFYFDSYVLIEVTDRCNLECPHCYHLPDNKIKDIPIESIISRIKTYPKELTNIILAGAEASLRKDLNELVSEIEKLGLSTLILTNGVKFADEDFVISLRENGSAKCRVSFGLNHPDYLGNKIIRDKQVEGIKNVVKHLTVGYIGYTMTNMTTELDYILTEITNNDWNCHNHNYRIRCGSEIGRNSTKSQIFVSDLYNSVKNWAMIHNISFEDVCADNNIYHRQVLLGNKFIRLIHWCDETNIDLEELRTGPWNDFVPDGITNFLHQIIRRDVWKNNKQLLPDLPPKRYHVGGQFDSSFIFDKNLH
jgi:hypothetical protein